MASIVFDPDLAEHKSPYIPPAETYYGSCNSSASPVKLTIATGGAGQSGLIKALADAFIGDQIKQTKCEPFGVSWLKSDTSASFNYLAQGSADLSITYHHAAEQIALKQGIADRYEYAWRDHFMLVGPKSNTANLVTDNNQNIYDLFLQIFCAAVKTASTAYPVRFLSRYDKSATNIKESAIWTAIGQVPWAYPYSFFYHQNPVFPFQALEVAAQLQEYTLVDRGTWFGVKDWVRDEMAIYMEGRDEDDTDILLNPARVLIGRYGKNKAMANAFADWMVRADGGQNIVESFAVNNTVLYTKAPVSE